MQHVDPIIKSIIRGTIGILSVSVNAISYGFKKIDDWNRNDEVLLEFRLFYSVLIGILLGFLFSARMYLGITNYIKHNQTLELSTLPKPQLILGTL